MQIRELETLASIVFKVRLGTDTDAAADELAEFVTKSASEGDLNVPFHKGIRDRIAQIMAGEIQI